MSRTRRLTLVLVGWTLFVWIGRIRNAGADADAIITSVVFIGLAVAALVARDRRVVTVLVGWTVLLWVFRLPLILVHDHPMSFKVVHTVLAAISIGLAALAQREVQREREAATAPARL